jgi:hypothetical protein
LDFGRHLQNRFERIHADAWCRLFRLESPTEVRMGI